MSTETSSIRLYKAKDRAIESVIEKMDKALREITSVVDGKVVAIKPLPWLKQSKNGHLFVEKTGVKSEKGTVMNLQAFRFARKPDQTTVWFSYVGADGYTRQAKNAFLVCDTKTGRKVYKQGTAPSGARAASSSAAYTDQPPF